MQIFTLLTILNFSDDVERPLFSAQTLKCTFQIENGNISPLRVAILLNAGQIVTNMNLDEISLWFQIIRFGLSYGTHCLLDRYII